MSVASIFATLSGALIRAWTARGGRDLWGQHCLRCFRRECWSKI